VSLIIIPIKVIDTSGSVSFGFHEFVVPVACPVQFERSTSGWQVPQPLVIKVNEVMSISFAEIFSLSER
jgi:hypothetical protein